MRRDGASGGAAVTSLPQGYSLETGGGPGRLVLGRPDGSVVGAFAFSAFGPTPEAAEEDRLRRGSPMGGNGEGGSGG